MVYQDVIRLETDRHGRMHNITRQVSEHVRESGIDAGTVHVFNVGSTAVIGTIEYEDGLERDMPEILDQLAPPSRDYGHELAWHDGNGHSHLQASILGPSLTVPIKNGRLVLGTWQQIFHLGCDVEPCHREVVVTVNGD